ncbi:MAG TPA: ATP-binding protein [Solirubrobacterales bacterium]|nr:ATP-binding protein [Solirubrobacterales bacterium]
MQRETEAARNPYTPDMGARPPFLAGRDPELAYFEELVRQLGAGGTQKHLILTGLRGVGKTVLLNEFEAVCDSAGWPGEVRELAEGSSIAPAVARSARKALVEMSTTKRAGEAIRRAMGVLKAFALTVGDITFRLDVDALDGVADSGDLAEDMRDVMVEVGLAAQANSSGFALILDEMQNLSGSDLEALIVGLHRAKQKNLPVALVGGGLPLLPGLTGEAKSYAERGFEFREIGALDRVAAAAALEEPARLQGVTWQAEAVDRVIDLAEGYPYFLQEYGRVIWRIRSGDSIGPRDAERAERVAREYLDENFFSQRIGKLPGGEQRYMAAIASLGDGPQRTGEIAAILAKEPQDLSGVRDRLIKASLLYVPKRGEVDFTVPLCADYIRRTIPFGPPSGQVLDELREERL